MAKKWTNRNMQGALHFVTFNVLDRRPIFRDPAPCRAFLTELQDLRKDRNCKLIAFVLMPDHGHVILNPRDGDIQTTTGVLKSLSAKRIIKLTAAGRLSGAADDQVWQESFKAIALWSQWMIGQKIDYIHANPVKDKLCRTAAEYRWTSFRAFYREEPNPLLQVDKEWCWPGDQEKVLGAVKELDLEKRERFENEIGIKRWVKNRLLK